MIKLPPAEQYYNVHEIHGVVEFSQHLHNDLSTMVADFLGNFTHCVAVGKYL